MNDLKPCPFCGRDATLSSMMWHSGVMSYSVVCQHYGCCNAATEEYNSVEGAVNAWNTRHDDKRKQDLLRDVHNLEIKLEELEKHLDEKDAIINRLVISLSGKAE